MLFLIKFHHFFGDRAKKAMKTNKGSNDED